MRAAWHGFADGWEEFLRLKISDRYLMAEQLDELIKQSNAAGKARPKDER